MKASRTDDVAFPPFSFLPVEDYLILRDRCTRVNGSDRERGRPSQTVGVVAALVLELIL
jgi:hypothetical protein